MSKNSIKDSNKINNKTIVIAHLYPDLLNLYGDRGNILTLTKRLQWRGINVVVENVTVNQTPDFSRYNLVFLGGGSDREQLIVCQNLHKIKDEFKSYVENNGSVIAICGGYQLLGNYYKLGDETIEGLKILDIETVRGDKRLIGNVVVEADFLTNNEGKNYIVGFENHGGATNINGHNPFAKVIKGNGNNGKDGFEGVHYKNVIGTYLHGPLLPKNPELADYILHQATALTLEPLNDIDEKIANNYIVNREAGHKNVV
ncbi:MAG: glutamine amidotransferase [Clostridiales bacterium]|jgi:CobQ-like glutamine amidotransferase family enzyme|nr:glutamine amidotransferase [Clostridiales bacterium]